METLSHHDLLALNNAIGEIYSARDLASFYSSAFSSIRGLIPGEHISCSEISRHPTRFLKVISASQDHSHVSQKHLPALNAHLHEHPLVPHFFSGMTFKTTDHASIHQFKNLAVYNEYYRYLEIETQIGFSFPLSPEKFALFGLSRKTLDYTERDKLLVTLLRPHLMSALRNVTELGRVTLERDLLQRGVEWERQGAILLQADGMILCLSSLAKELCGKYFHADLAEGKCLSATLLQWFNAETNYRKMRVAAKLAMRVERDPLIVEKEGRTLKIRLFNDPVTGESILSMVESDPALQLHNLRGFGLSSRETEVLQWLAKGKTNNEIATILSMSKRTADKHLEHIFAKLGVETRAAAAAIMRKESALF